MGNAFPGVGTRTVERIAVVWFLVGACKALPLTTSSNLFNYSQPEVLGLTYAPGTETHTVFKLSEATDQFSNRAVITIFKGELYCMWQSSVRIEDAPDTWVAYSRSTDGISWTEPGFGTVICMWFIPPIERMLNIRGCRLPACLAVFPPRIERLYDVF